MVVLSNIPPWKYHLLLMYSTFMNEENLYICLYQTYKSSHNKTIIKKVQLNIYKELTMGRMLFFFNNSSQCIKYLHKLFICISKQSYKVKEQI